MMRNINKLARYVFLIFIGNNVMADTILDLCQDFDQIRPRLVNAEKRINQNKKDFAIQENYKVGGTFFAPMYDIRPGQNAISYKGVCLNLLSKSQNKQDFPTLSFDNDKSIISLKSAKKALLAPQGKIILVDGHHSYIASMLSGAISFPVEIMEDFSQLNWEEFWAYVVQKEYIFLANYINNIPTTPQAPKQFSQLVNDPLRGALDESLALVTSEGKLEIFVPNSIGIRYEQDMPPFLEFKLAEQLYKIGVRIPKESMEPLAMDLILKIQGHLLSMDWQKYAGLKIFDTPFAKDELEKIQLDR